MSARALWVLVASDALNDRVVRRPGGERTRPRSMLAVGVRRLTARLCAIWPS